MKDWKERLIEEKEDLLDKVIKLEDFIEDDPVFLGLSKQEKRLLNNQKYVMWYYYNILLDRIDLIEEDKC